MKMNVLFLVWRYLVARPLNTVLNVLLLSMGVAVITTIIIVNRQLGEKINENTTGIDLVVGAKGSPLQLILCNIFHIDFPTGNISLREAERLAKHRLVRRAIPLALGDSYRNFRIVGTDTSYTGLYGGELASGNWWHDEMEVVAGASVAAALNLAVGNTFASAHGLTEEGSAHEDTPYRVVGILKPTGKVIDNLLFTDITSVWHTHAHEDHEEDGAPTDPSPLVKSINAGDSTKEITSLLLKYRNPIAAIQLPRMINSNTNMQAASPAFETARLFTILGVGIDMLVGMASVIILISALSIFIALYNSLKDRRYDLAIMRSMGATRLRLFDSVIIEGATLAFMGSILGILTGHAVVRLLVAASEEGMRSGLTAWVFYGEEAWLLAGSLLLGFVCSVIPAVQAYRTDIHHVLAGN